MINNIDSLYDHNSNTTKKYETLYHVGEVLENKNNSNEFAMISEIRITRNGMNFVLGFDQNTYDFIDVEIVTKEELIEKWKKPDSTKIIFWGKISKLSTNLGLSEISDKEYAYFEKTKKEKQKVLAPTKTPNSSY